MDVAPGPLPSMPPEIIVLIVGAVADSIPRARHYHDALDTFPAPPEIYQWRRILLRLGKVSRAWHEAVRPLLLRHAGFCLGSPSDWRLYVSSIFGYLLQLAPQSFGVVRSLHLNLKEAGYTDSADLALMDQHTAGLIALLPLLDSLSIAGGLRRFPATAEQLTSLKQRITNLDFGGIEDPAVDDCIRCCIHNLSASLRSLRIAGMTGYAAGRVDLSTWSKIFDKLLHLESLALENVDTSGLFERGSSTSLASMPRLRHLHLGRQCMGAGTLQLVRANESTLESLSIHQESLELFSAAEKEDPGAPLSFPRLRRLRYCGSRHRGEEGGAALQVIRGFSLPRLETLIIVCGARLYIHLPALVAEMRSIKTLICGCQTRQVAAVGATDTDNEALVVNLRRWAPSVSVSFATDDYHFHRETYG